MIGWIYIVILVELAAVSWIDIKIKKISNKWVMVNVGLAVASNLIYPDLYQWGWQSLIFPLGWIIAGFLLYLLGVMGAGDSKFLASLFLLLPLDQHSLMFEKILYSTFVVGLVMLTIKIAKDFKIIKAYALSAHWNGLKASIKSSFSFAPVIFIAWILLGVELWM